MSSVQSLREFISERLTAAAEEIFTEFEKTIVRYEEEIDRQRRLMDISWRPEITSVRTEFPLHHDWKEEELLTDQQLCDTDMNSSLDQEEPETLVIKEETEESEPPLEEPLPLQMKEGLEEPQPLTIKEETEEPEPPLEEPESQHMEDQKELCISQDEEQLILKQEVDTVMVTPNFVDKEQSEPEPNCDQLLSPYLLRAENQNQEGRKNEDSGSRDEELQQNQRTPQTSGGRHEVDSPKPKRHKKTLTGEKPFSCQTCGKGFGKVGHLTAHMRTHTAEKPYPCEICGKRFNYKSNLTEHTRTHTGEKPYPCETCGKRFGYSSNLTEHMRTHTGEKPFLCLTCGKRFTQQSTYDYHQVRQHFGT